MPLIGGLYLAMRHPHALPLLVVCHRPGHHVQQDQGSPGGADFARSQPVGSQPGWVSLLFEF